MEAPREVERRLAPYGLVLKNGAWYLAAAPVATTGGQVRTYRVGNILRLTPTAERFERPASFALGDFWAEHLHEFDRRRLSRTAVVRVSPDLVRRLPDLPDAALRRAAEGVAPGADGWTTVDLPVEHDDVAARQLLPHAGDVEVLSPASLRELLLERARSMVATYERVAARVGDSPGRLPARSA